jgi:hypothetical protein
MIRRCHRFTWSCLIAVAALSASTLVSSRSLADDDFDSIVANDYEAELCGWATHDSCPFAVSEVSTEPTPADTTTPRPLANLDESLAALATAACASAGVSVEQIVEPFAMVGPHFQQSLQSVKNFQQWWENAAEQTNETSAVDPVVDEATNSGVPTAQVNHVPIVDFAGELADDEPEAENLASVVETSAADAIEIAEVAEYPLSFEDDHCWMDHNWWLDQANDDKIRGELAELAAKEPVDVLDNFDGAFGPSVLVESVEELATTIAAESSMVGSSAMIFSLDEEYLPYDLAVRDYQAESLFSLAKRPFCIRARIELPEFDLAIDTDQPAEPIEQAADSDFVFAGSADCLLDDWMWRATLALEPGGSVRKWLRAELAGQQLAALLAKRVQLADEMAGQLASWWPESPQHPAGEAGAQLLARAGAVEAIDQESIADSQDADANPTEALANDDAEQLVQAAAAIKQWVNSIEAAAATWKSRWLPRLAQTSPAGDLPASQRR